ncbi:hypothetical protein GCM10007989_38420 [Devosia pacifica]|uniref:HXXEE domain-containing protein n=1 Tax=Devosia pacifica TaxID=1335967 RepID=A0A918SH96_9HYPH|nr:hypothetical protein [Devosia pacifica]GHA38993.1 hypothetical protein GCM10007989_38420 [Devosia pacifica]
MSIAILAATALTAAVLAAGYFALGFWTMLIFTSGFVTGLVLFSVRPGIVSFSAIRLPFFIAFGLFVVHRVEEYLFYFFDHLAAITGVATPNIASPSVILMVVLSVGAWLLVPVLAGKSRFGTYLAWTFFSAMGITELAHILVLPVIVGRAFQYFPGAASVVLLAPAAWWGLAILWRRARP